MHQTAKSVFVIVTALSCLGYCVTIDSESADSENGLQIEVEFIEVFPITANNSKSGTDNSDATQRKGFQYYHIEEDEHDHVPLGSNKYRNVTFDEDGTPYVHIDPLELLLIGAVFAEHNEEFLHDFPGHKTIMPTSEVLQEPDEQGASLSADEQGASLSAEEQGASLSASLVDPSLRGQVHPNDEEHLKEMIADKPPKLVRHRRAYRTRDAKPWPKGEYPYVFDRNILKQARDQILKAMKQIEKGAPCVKFVPANRNSKNYIIHTSGEASRCMATTLGFSPGESMVYIGELCDYPVTMHEIFHILGASHTQMRPDRDHYIQINWPNIQPSMMSNFNRNQGRLRPEDNEYDYGSTMQYPSKAFAINSNYDTVRPSRGGIRLPLYGHAEFDEQDYKSLRKWYGCGEKKKKKKSKNKGKNGITGKVSKKDRGRKNKTKRAVELDGSYLDCLLSPWSPWSTCESDKKVKTRFIVQQSVGDGLKCPEESELTREELCRVNINAIADTNNGLKNKDGVENGDMATADLKKSVTIVEGLPIILVLSNPKNFPVQWYHVIDGKDVEISKSEDRYQASRTASGNSRLTIYESTPADDGRLVVSKLIMNNTVLRVAWSIEVHSEDEYFSKTLKL